MKPRVLPRSSLLAAFAIALLFISAMPLSHAAQPRLAPAATAPTLSGAILNAGTFVTYTYTRITPVVNGSLDSPNSRYTFTDFDGTFSFDNVPDGDYSLDVEPYCVSDALPIQDYRFAVNSGGGAVNLGSISLPTPVKRIRGTVTLGTAPQPGLTVWAYNSATYANACAQTNSSGQYSLGVSGGSWDVSVSAQAGAAWMFTQTRPTAQFASDNTTQISTINLALQPTNGSINGRVLGPNGLPLALPTPTGSNYAVSIDIWNPADGSYAYNNLNADGTFTVPVVAGRYQVSVWVDNSTYPSYTGPADVTVEASTGALTIPDLQLRALDRWIVGKVQDNQIPPQPLSGIDVQAYAPGGGFFYARTDPTGAYVLNVPQGIWNVYAAAPPNTDYLDANQTISTTAALTQTLDLSLIQGLTIQGTAVDSASLAPLPGVDAWAYVRRSTSPDYLDVEHVTNGGFSLHVPNEPGTIYKVGLMLAPGSPYSFDQEVAPAALANGRAAIDQSLGTAQMAMLEQSAHEQTFTVPSAGAAATSATKFVQVPLIRNDARIAGQLRDAKTGQPIAGVSGTVVASPVGSASSWQWIDFKPDGSYDLPLPAGSWYVGYYLDGTTYGTSITAPVLVTVSAGQTAKQDFTAQVLDGMIDGTVFQTDGVTPIPSTYVWVRGKSFEQYALTDQTGHFRVYVPLNDGPAIARYTVGTAFVCDPTSVCPVDGLDAAPQDFDAVPRVAASTAAFAPQSISLTARKKGGAVRLSGTVTNSGGSPVKSVNVSFVVPDDGPVGDDDTDSKGKYSLDVTFAADQTRVRYNLSAAYYLNSEYYPFESQYSLVLDVPKSASAAHAALALTPQDATLRLGAPIALPKGGSFLFNVADGWSYTLSDGMQIQIPANAVPLSSGESQVRVVIRPSPLLPPTALYDQATYYGYTINLYEANSGKPITQPLLADAVLTLRYDEKVLAKRQAFEATIRPASFTSNIWQPTDQFVVNRQTNKVTVQTRTLGSWALIRPQINLDQHALLPLVRR